MRTIGGCLPDPFCIQEFEELDLHSEFVQQNLSFNRHEGTLKGLHFQKAVAAEIKIMRCIAGRMYDVVIDIRKGSPTEGQN